MKSIELKHGVDVPVKETSGKGQLSKRDWLIGLLMTVAPPMLTYAYDAVMAFLSYEPVEFDWRTLLKFGLSSGAIYIVKNLTDASKIIITKKDYEEAKS